ncbi:SUKH-3 domain-containing protein [Streptomyces lavendulae]|uniref:SUKH-3 domain-containing protein n=1 Tax=Streptomyces lavendulae TaxID=1914 RepID=UPI0024A04474|nr:hypothetical protein Slala05_81220 [Streptomyces lavendulae subsp. lavendulae]
MINFDSLQPALVRSLLDAGWHPQRAIDVTPWLDSLRQEGYQANPKAEEILTALGD